MPRTAAGAPTYSAMEYSVIWLTFIEAHNHHRSLQVPTLQYVDGETLAAAAAAAAAEVRRQKLDILERLLWAMDFGGGALGAPPQAAGRSGRGSCAHDLGPWKHPEAAAVGQALWQARSQRSSRQQARLFRVPTVAVHRSKQCPARIGHSDVPQGLARLQTHVRKSTRCFLVQPGGESGGQPASSTAAWALRFSERRCTLLMWQSPTSR